MQVLDVIHPMDALCAMMGTIETAYTLVDLVMPLAKHAMDLAPTNVHRARLLNILMQTMPV